MSSFKEHQELMQAAFGMVGEQLESAGCEVHFSGRSIARQWQDATFQLWALGDDEPPEVVAECQKELNELMDELHQRGDGRDQGPARGLQRPVRERHEAEPGGAG